MRTIPQHIVEQVHELERLRAAGCISDALYRNARAAIVRASRRAAAAAHAVPSPGLQPTAAGSPGDPS